MRCRCAHCGNVYVRLGNQRYCSPECARSARSIKQRQRRLRNNGTTPDLPTRNIARAAHVLNTIHDAQEGGYPLSPLATSSALPGSGSGSSSVHAIADLQAMIVALSSQLSRQNLAAEAAEASAAFTRPTVPSLHLASSPPAHEGPSTPRAAVGAAAAFLDMFIMLLGSACDDMRLYRQASGLMRPDDYIANDMAATLDRGQAMRLAAHTLAAIRDDPITNPLGRVGRSAVQRAFCPESAKAIFNETAPRSDMYQEDSGYLPTETGYMPGTGLSIDAGALSLPGTGASVPYDMGPLERAGGATGFVPSSIGGFSPFGRTSAFNEPSAGGGQSWGGQGMAFDTGFVPGMPSSNPEGMSGSLGRGPLNAGFLGAYGW